MHWENSPKHHLHRTPRNKLRVSPPCFTSLYLIQPLTVPERKKKRKKKIPNTTILEKFFSKTRLACADLGFTH